MASGIETEVIERETIKPSSPTPQNHRINNLCLLDQISPAYWIPLLLFFRKNTDLINTSERSQFLKKSLSQTLTRFYTFAGRLRDNVAIECNDEGAEFVVARVHCSLSAILENPDPATLTSLAPSEALPKEALFTSPLLMVKASFFDCGGMAIGVCLSHKAGDAATLSTFLNSWATATTKSELEPALVPEFLSCSIFPPKDSLASLLESYHELVTQKNVEVKRLVFSGQKIDALTSKAASNSTVRNPTRVEAVSALIWKCAIEASAACNQRGSVYTQGVNIRKRLEPSLPESAAGNLVMNYLAKSSSEANKTELKDLVVILRKEVEELDASCKAGIGPEEVSRRVEKLSMLWRDAGVHRLVASTWCRFPIYDADFGWGKPAWACVPNLRVISNVVVMMDTSDGDGIEVLLSLREEEMRRFETNPELLAFASLDPKCSEEARQYLLTCPGGGGSCHFVSV